MKNTGTLIRWMILLAVLAAFACPAAAETVTLPSGLERIEEEAFAGCESLEGVLVVPLGVDVDATAFSGTAGLDIVRGVAVVGDDGTPWNGTLNHDVWSAVSPYCEARGISCLYTTDAESAIRAGYNIVITVGFLASDPVASLQTAYPDVRFICLDAAVENRQDNVYAVQYSCAQAGFMAGYAAVQRGYRFLGFMGGIDVPDVVSYGEGFVRGANQAAVELDVENQVYVAYTYTGTFAPGDSVYQTAASWYEGGVEIIFSAGGDQAASVNAAAAAADRYMIGVDTDQSVNLDRVLFSAAKNLGFTATEALADIMAGRWSDIAGTGPTLGLVSNTPADNHVCLMPVSEMDADVISRLRSGAYVPSGAYQIRKTDGPIEGMFRRLAVVGSEENPASGTFDAGVWSQVSSFCTENGIEATYTTDVEDALSCHNEVVIAVGFGFADAVSELQDNYPDVRFICLDTDVENRQSNVYTVTYNCYQGGFMAGYAAVMKGYHNLGFMGAMAIPDIVDYGEGFIRGANQAALELDETDRVTVRRVYTGTFAPDNDVYQTAASWYEGGTEIIFCCGGGMCSAVIDAAEDHDGLMIGVDTDQAYLGSRVVTSTIKNMGFTAVDALRRILDGGWDSLGGTSACLGVVSDAPDSNHVCLSPGTQFGYNFTYSAYSNMVARLHGGIYPSGAIRIQVMDAEGEMTVSTSEEMNHLTSPCIGLIRIVPEELVVLGKALDLEGELRVETGNNFFNSLLIPENGSLTLSDGAILGTYSGWSEAFGGFALAQVWLDGGTLDASHGIITQGSTIFYNGGILLLTPENKTAADITGGARTEADLRAFAADSRFDQLMIQGDMTLTQDLTLPVDTRINDNTTVVIGSGCTLTIPDGVTLTVAEGCTLEVNGGAIIGTVQVEGGTYIPGE